MEVEEGERVFDVMERMEDCDDDEGGGPARSVDGWDIIVTGIHEEATDEDLKDKALEFGTVRTLSLLVDRKTGYAKGCAFVQYEEKEEAEQAIAGLNGTMFMSQAIYADWAFKTPTRRQLQAADTRENRSRSPSPEHPHH